MAAASSSRFVIYAALAGNFMVAVTKFIAAAWTGSSAMLSEGVHSLVDTGNELLLLYGMHRAEQPPDAKHPLGHGRELYFWSFIVALLIFSLGAGVSFYEGVMHIRNPVAITDPMVAYVVLGLSAIFETGSWWVAFKAFNARRGDLGFFEAAIRSRDPTTFIVLFEDSAAVLGLSIAFAGTFLAYELDMPVLDGVASLGISLILVATAVFLAREAKGLLIGEPALQKVQNSLQEIAEQQLGVDKAFNLMTVHLGPNQIVAAVDVDFDDDLPARTVEETVRTLEQRFKESHPEVVAVFVKPKSASRDQSV